MRTTSPSSACGPTRTDSRSENGPCLTACSTGPAIQRTIARLMAALSSWRSSRASNSARSASRPASVPSMTLPSAMTLSPAAIAASASNVARRARLGGHGLRQRLLLRGRPVGRMHDAPGAARHALPRRRQHVGDPGRARRRLPPQRQQFARKLLPGQPQQRRGALLLVQAALRGQPRLRRGDALAPQLPLLLESAWRMRARASAWACVRSASARAFASPRICAHFAARSASTRSSSARPAAR